MHQKNGPPKASRLFLFFLARSECRLPTRRCSLLARCRCYRFDLFFFRFFRFSIPFLLASRARRDRSRIIHKNESDGGRPCQFQIRPTLQFSMPGAILPQQPHTSYLRRKVASGPKRKGSVISLRPQAARPPPVPRARRTSDRRPAIRSGTMCTKLEGLTRAAGAKWCNLQTADGDMGHPSRSRRVIRVSFGLTAITRHTSFSST